MKKFEFSSKSTNDEVSIFCGEVFYVVYKYADFLRYSENIETILSKGYELRRMLKGVEPGQRVTVSGMMLAENGDGAPLAIYNSCSSVCRGAVRCMETPALNPQSLKLGRIVVCTPLVVMRTGPNVSVQSHEFTANRLTGLVAAYAFDHRSRFPDLKSSEAQTLGLTWDNRDKKKCKLYLSAVSGTEHFDKHFQYWPLVCGLRKLQLKKITIEPILKMAKIKNQDGLRMANQLMRNLAVVKELWSYFPETSNADFKMQIKSLPLELKKVFFNMK